MRQEIVKRINEAIKRNPKAMEIAQAFCNGKNNKESNKALVNQALPDLVLSLFNNPTEKMTQALYAEIGEDPTARLQKDLKEIQKTFNPILLDDQRQTFEGISSALSYYRDLAEQSRLMLAALYVQGFVQEPKN